MAGGADGESCGGDDGRGTTHGRDGDQVTEAGEIGGGTTEKGRLTTGRSVNVSGSTRARGPEPAEEPLH